MTFNFTQKELSYLAKLAGLKRLEGFDMVDFDADACAQSLQEKGYIHPGKKKPDLSEDVSILLYAWRNVRYTLLRDDFLTESHLFGLLVNSAYILTYSSHNDDIQIALCDYSVAVMDQLLADYLSVDATSGCLDTFNVSFSGNDFLKYFQEEIPNATISAKTGLQQEHIALIKDTLRSETSVAFVVQDVVKGIGCMGVIQKLESGYMMVKHIVPNFSMNKQRVVAVKGNSQDIIDSVYLM